MITTHERTAIRHYVVGVLSASHVVGGNTVYATNAETRIYLDRVSPFLSSDGLYPRIAVYTPNEPIDEKESSVWSDPDNPGHLRRQLFLDVAIVDLAEHEDGLDNTALQIEQAIDSDCTFGKLIDSEMLIDTRTEFADQGDTTFAVMRLRYLIVYYTPSRTPDPAAGWMASEIFASVDPDIGIPHFNDYVELTNTGIPPVGPPTP